MNFRNEIWTYLTVTGMTLIIWLLADRETREPNTIALPVDLAVVGSVGEWSVTPEELSITLNVEGSAQAIRELKAVAQSEPLKLELLQEPGEIKVDLGDRIPMLEAVRDTLVTVLSVEPAIKLVTVDRIESATATVRPVLPNAQTEGKVTTTPAQITLRMPGRLRRQLPEDLHVEAVVDSSVLDDLQPDVTQTLTVPLRLPEAMKVFDGIERIQLIPEHAEVTFKLRSRIREYRMDLPVRVHLAGPPADFLEYDISLEPAVLRDVTISATAEIIEMIRSHRATVVAVLHLSNQDKAQAIASKPIAYFQMLGEGWVEGRQVTGWVGDDRTRVPEIGLTIARRE